MTSSSESRSKSEKNSLNSSMDSWSKISLIKYVKSNLVPENIIVSNSFRTSLYDIFFESAISLIENFLSIDWMINNLVSELEPVDLITLS